MLCRLTQVYRSIVTGRVGVLYSTVSHTPNTDDFVFKPAKKSAIDENDDVLRSRLLYQSKKRGILENDLILGGFASSYLNGLNRKQMDEYDEFINGGHNEWDIYYWLSDAKPVPEDINTEVYKMLHKFAWKKAAIWHISPEKLDKM